MELLNISSLRTPMTPFAARIGHALALLVASVSLLQAQLPPFLEVRIPKPAERTPRRISIGGSEPAAIEGNAA